MMGKILYWWWWIDSLNLLISFHYLIPFLLLKKVAQEFFDLVYKLHGLPVTIISDRDPIFLSRFWSELLQKVGIKLNLTTAYHPQ